MKQIILLSVVALFSLTAFAETPADLQDKARAMEAKLILNAIYAGEKSIFIEYNKYTASFKELGVPQDGPMRTHIFTSLEKVPKHYLPMIPADMKPQVADTEFRITTILHSGNKVFVNSIDQNKKLLEKIYVIPQKDRKFYTLPEQYTFKAN